MPPAATVVAAARHPDRRRCRARGLGPTMSRHAIFGAGPRLGLACSAPRPLTSGPAAPRRRRCWGFSLLRTHLSQAVAAPAAAAAVAVAASCSQSSRRGATGRAHFGRTSWPRLPPRLRRRRRCRRSGAAPPPQARLVVLVVAAAAACEQGGGRARVFSCLLAAVIEVGDSRTRASGRRRPVVSALPPGVRSGPCNGTCPARPPLAAGRGNRCASGRPTGPGQGAAAAGCRFYLVAAQQGISFF